MPEIGRAVYCRTCGQRKAPRGRSVPLCMYLCDHECPGWEQAPHPGDLWPEETAEQFGFPCEGPSEEGETTDAD